jgi:hypothetical protein
MVFMVTLLVIVALGLPVLVVLALRRWGTDQAATEQSLLSPDAHTVSYVVPEGEDPTFARAALAHAGFVSVLDRSGDQRLVVRCEPGQREQVRSILEQTDHPTVEHGLLAHVPFDDEPVQAQPHT